MKKIIYPEKGIYHLCQNDLEKCLQAIKNARDIDYVIPVGFGGAKYLAQLPKELETYYYELESIIDKIKNSSTTYEYLADTLTNEAKGMQEPIVKDRDRLIIK